MRRPSRVRLVIDACAALPVLFVNPRSGGGRGGAGEVGRGGARARDPRPSSSSPHHDLAALVDEAVADGADALGGR